LDIILQYKYNDEEEYQSYIVHSTITHPKEFTDAIQDILKNIEFDHFSGKMYTETNRIIPCIERCDNSYLQDIFGFEHIKFDFESCTVCFRDTQTKTPCQHALCYVCWTEILKREKPQQQCPICREQINR
jgi:hypothetical protein